MEYSEVNPASTDEKKREAICKRCGVIWHPRKTDARRPTRCPYCHSHRTEWLDQHSELLDSKDDEVKADVETEDEEWNNPDYSMEESMEDTGICLDYAKDETEEESSDNSSKTDYTAVYV